MYSCHFDEAASTPLWAVPCQPYPVRAEQSNSTKGTSQLLARWDLQGVAEGLQHHRVAGVEDSPAPNLERDIDGVEALLPEVACQRRRKRRKSFGEGKIGAVRDWFSSKVL